MPASIDFKDVIPITVNHLGFFYDRHTLCPCRVIEMHVSMDKILWRIPVYKLPKALKAPMTLIRPIVYMTGRRMSDDNIYAFLPPYF
jgi:hypothetical protein